MKEIIQKLLQWIKVRSENSDQWYKYFSYRRMSSNQLMKQILLGRLHYRANILEIEKAEENRQKLRFLIACFYFVSADYCLLMRNYNISSGR